MRVKVLDAIEGAAEAQNGGAFRVTGGDSVGKNAAGDRRDLYFVRDDVSVVVQNAGGGFNGLAETAVDVGNALQKNTNGNVTALRVVGAVKKVGYVAVCGIGLESFAPK